jgi:hypothetical protein
MNPVSLTAGRYTGNNALRGAANSGFMFWHDQLISIFVMFQSKDAEKTFDALKKKIEDKYGAMKEKAKFSGKDCEVRKGSLGIVLSYKNDPVEGRQTTIGATHIALMEAMEKQSIEKKAAALGNL